MEGRSSRSRRLASRPGRAEHVLLVGNLSEAPDVGGQTIPAVAAALPHAGRLEAFFRRRGHLDEARDLVQELFVLLVSKGQDVVTEPPGRFRSFLFSLAYRIGANASRKRRRREPAETMDVSFPAAGADPERITIARDQARRAAAALQALPEGTRKALLLVADEGRSIAEAARALGVSEDAVRARLCRGRRRIAAILESPTERSR